MYKIIGENNKVNYGCIDEPVEWNYEEFKLRDFFNKEITGLKKKFAYHQFNYIGITAGKYLVGFATVDLGYLKNVFGFIYTKEQGVILESDDKCLGFSKKMNFPRNPDNYLTTFTSGKTSVHVEKSHDNGMLSIDCNFKDRLNVKGSLAFSIQTHQPWHVYDESGSVDLIFTPEGERNDKINGGPLVKTIFRQFVGSFDGIFRPVDGEKVEFKDVKGFCEIHRAIW